MKKILEKVNQQIAENLYHGASLAIFKEGHWQEYYLGTIDGENPVKPDLVYDLASVSKVVGVATVAAFLVDQGKLDIDKTLSFYYSDFKNDGVTVRQLLTHTSGIDPFIPNRDQLNSAELKAAINQISVTDKKDFLYTDINFLLLGFMLEEVSGLSLNQLFKQEIFNPWQMTQTNFGPNSQAVPTVKGISDGFVHDPKAKVLKEHAGSAGLFSTVKDLETFLEHYLQDDFAKDLWENLSPSPEKRRALGWNLDGDWIDHTGYTGSFIMANRKAQQAIIFLTNRTYEKDNRPEWIAKRKELMAVMVDVLNLVN
ncbi:serine hydrolase [Streptococcus thoraltensis]|uniref:serine hydrolase domain-containing protein n=1 Tax=Streptococcus thoraltensis TaxID=55085 RepID=UPI00036F6A24|nr:serine hydrolase domain-containing protein [Streptococcus thoraltensis]MDY4760672.1 serine hydrolase domain-containing protein [Streptococcus thoraltensis]